jgi:hypothetical protein
MKGDKNELFVNTHTTDISGLTDSVNIHGQIFPLSHFNETTLNTAAQKAGGDNKSIFSLIILHSQVATGLENRNLLTRLKYTDPSGIQRDLNLGTLNGCTVLIDDGMPMVDGNFVSYLLGSGAFIYADAGVKVPYEVWRDPKEKGGIDQLLTRQRKLFAPYGISFTMTEMQSKSPGLDELANGINWELVQNSQKTAAIDIKSIPIARIISKG